MSVWLIVVCAALAPLILIFVVATAIFFKVLKRKDDPVFDEGKVDLSPTHYGPYVDKLVGCITRMRGEKSDELCITSYDGKKLYADY